MPASSTARFPNFWLDFFNQALLVTPPCAQPKCQQLLFSNAFFQNSTAAQSQIHTQDPCGTFVYHHIPTHSPSNNQNSTVPFCNQALMCVLHSRSSVSIENTMIVTVSVAVSGPNPDHIFCFCFSTTMHKSSLPKHCSAFMASVCDQTRICSLFWCTQHGVQTRRELRPVENGLPIVQVQHQELSWLLRHLRGALHLFPYCCQHEFPFSC